MKKSLLLTRALSSLTVAALAGSAVAAFADSDIAAAGSGLTLGSGWYVKETNAGRTFHWANNDVPIIIHSPQGSVKRITVEIEGGPGLADAQHFTLHLRDSSKHDIASIVVPGSEKARFDVPTTPGQTKTVYLHVDGGGKKIPKDTRVLNFRVFNVSEANDNSLAAGHPDIMDSDVSLGDNWYPLEQSKGETFRWVDNDAAFNVSGGKHKLEVTAASGPAVASPAKWTLALEDSSGKVVQSQTVKARSTVMFDLPAGNGSYKLHVQSNGAKSPGDPRTLSFRVFKLDAQ